MKILARSAEATFEVGRALGARCRGGEVLALAGPLGAGKTVLAKGVAAGLGIARESVTSPTFVGIVLHKGRLLFAHADAYRFGTAEAFAKEGWDELTGGVRLVEWADRVASLIPSEALWVRMDFALAPDERSLELETADPERALLKGLDGFQGGC